MRDSSTREGELVLAGDAADVQRALFALTSTLRGSCSEDLAQMRAELGQVRSLTTTAIAALQSSFRDLDALIRAQSDTLDSLLTLGSEPASANELNIASFVGEVGPLFRSLAELVARVVARGEDGARRAEGLASDVATTLELLRQFQSVEAKTFILGLNASIEASRAGDRGKAFAIVAQEVRAVATYSKELNGRIADQLQRAHAALSDVRVTLVESATRDAEGAEASKAEIDDLLHKLAALDVRLARDLARIREVSECVTRQVAIAVQALQFEDMTTQLVDCLGRRVARIEASIDCLHQAAEVSVDSGIALAGALREQAEAVLAVYAIELRSPVAQQDTTSGSVDFF